MASPLFYRLLGQLQNATHANALAEVVKEIKLAKDGEELQPGEIDLLRVRYNEVAVRAREIKVSGTSFRQGAVRDCRAGDRLRMMADPCGQAAAAITGNPKARHADENAILLVNERTRGFVGYIPKEMTGNWIGRINKAAEAGQYLTAQVSNIVGGEGSAPTVGLRILGPEIE